MTAQIDCKLRAGHAKRIKRKHHRAIRRQAVRELSHLLDDMPSFAWPYNRYHGWVS